MRFLMLYRTSVYLTLVLATLVLSFDRAEENRLAMLYPPAVAAAGLVALLTVDRRPKIGLSPALANPLAIVALGLAYLEYQSNPAELVLPLGHLLVYLQLIKIFQVKTVEDDWYLMLLGLVQVVVGGYLSQSDAAGAVLFAWVVASIWALMLGHLYRESARGRTPGAGRAAALIPPDKEPYPGLLDVPFFASVLGVVVTTILLGSFIFLALPRRGNANATVGAAGGGQHLSGFSEEVRLGQLGEILENTAVVMEVETSDKDGRRIQPEEEILWRGVALYNYGSRRWRRSSQDRPGAVDLSTYSGPITAALLKQRIRLESTDGDVLFGVRSILKADAPRKAVVPQLRPLDGSLFRPDVAQGPYEYEVWSHPGDAVPQIGEAPITPSARRMLVGIDPPTPQRPGPGRLTLSLRAFAQRVLAERQAGPDSLARARALEAYLRDSGEFEYSLKQEQIDRGIDPVEDFLLNRRRGHCEYFASALTLLLRSLDIPARMINGFKGGDYNDLTGITTVRQKHAHSWVEAWVALGPDEEGWVTFDATPAARDEAVRTGGVGKRARVLGDFVRQLWYFYIVGFNAERQERILYQPVQRLWRQAIDGYSEMGRALRKAFAWLFDFPSASSIFSVRGFLASVVFMVTALGLAWLGRRACRWLVRRLRGSSAWNGSLSVGAGPYRRLLQVLATAGLRPAEGETPREFARRAARSLPDDSDRLPEVDGPPLPSAVAEVYYLARYGRVDPDPDEIRDLDRRIDALSDRLRRSGRVRA